MYSPFNGVFWLMPVMYWWVTIIAIAIGVIAIFVLRKILKSKNLLFYRAYLVVVSPIVIFVAVFIFPFILMMQIIFRFEELAKADGGLRIQEVVGPVDGFTIMGWRQTGSGKPPEITQLDGCGLLCVRFLLAGYRHIDVHIEKKDYPWQFGRSGYYRFFLVERPSNSCKRFDEVRNAHGGDGLEMLDGTGKCIDVMELDHRESQYCSFGLTERETKSTSRNPVTLHPYSLRRLSFVVVHCESEREIGRYTLLSLTLNPTHPPPTFAYPPETLRGFGSLDQLQKYVPEILPMAAETSLLGGPQHSRSSSLQHRNGSI